MKQIFLRFAIALTISGYLHATDEPSAPTKFENRPGWTWHVEPARANWTLRSDPDVVMRLDELNNDKLLLTLARSRASDREIARLRPVAFDAAGKRFEFQSDSGGSVAEVALKGYVLDSKTLPRDQIKFIGLEKLTRENLRKVIAPAAFRELKAAGVEALSYPVVGERCDFELTSLDGQKIRSKDLRGKIVLLDFWAKWCGPCMAKMPKLKDTYQKLNSRGFEIIGLNHDYSLKDARRAIADQKLPWANVLAPSDEDHRKLWSEATGTGSLPRLLLIDRDGILRAETSPHHLDAELEKLMGEP